MGVTTTETITVAPTTIPALEIVLTHPPLVERSKLTLFSDAPCPISVQDDIPEHDCDLLKKAEWFFESEFLYIVSSINKKS